MRIQLSLLVFINVRRTNEMSIFFSLNYYVILGFVFAEVIGLFALIIAFLLLYVV
jgi:F0F1-type ATP synthase membrane subunit c/vacuolar-type H+-ATPase subunit K